MRAHPRFPVLVCVLLAGCFDSYLVPNAARLPACPDAPLVAVQAFRSGEELPVHVRATCAARGAPPRLDGKLSGEVVSDLNVWRTVGAPLMLMGLATLATGIALSTQYPGEATLTGTVISTTALFVVGGALYGIGRNRRPLEVQPSDAVPVVGQ